MRDAGSLEARVVRIPAGDAVLHGALSIPSFADGLVICADANGSGPRSAHTAWLAGELAGHGLATLVVDLLTSHEERNAFDLEQLASRLVAVTRWVAHEPAAEGLALGWFTSGSVAAASLIAEPQMGGLVRALATRSGRIELAVGSLSDVSAPLLMIVGGADPDELQTSREALYLLRGEKRLQVIPGATALFDEPGSLERVAYAAAKWFVRHLADPVHGAPAEVRRSRSRASAGLPLPSPPSRAPRSPS